MTIRYVIKLSNNNISNCELNKYDVSNLTKIKLYFRVKYKSSNVNGNC